MSTAAAIGPDNAFAGVIGHARVMSLLADEIAAPAHAYYFVGPIGVGKATVARRFAAAILCEEGGRHVTDCSSCRRVLSGNHPDVTAVEPEGRLALGVDEARSTVALANLAPVEGDRKVILFEDAGAMTDAAANALLKTLEEPSPSTVFLLVSESEDDLPATIASRCRTVQFGRVGETDLVDRVGGRRSVDGTSGRGGANIGRASRAGSGSRHGAEGGRIPQGMAVGSWQGVAQTGGGVSSRR